MDRRTLELLEHAVYGARAAAARHAHVELVLVLDRIGGGSNDVGHGVSVFLDVSWLEVIRVLRMRVERSQGDLGSRVWDCLRVCDGVVSMYSSVTKSPRYCRGWREFISPKERGGVVVVFGCVRCVLV